MATACNSSSTETASPCWIRRDNARSSDSVSNGHFSDYHRFFPQAAWNIDDLWRLQTKLIIKRLVGEDAVIVLAGDDTLCCKRGLGIFGTGINDDALSSSNSKTFAIGVTTGLACASSMLIRGGRHRKSFSADLSAPESISRGADAGENRKTKRPANAHKKKRIKEYKTGRRESEADESQREVNAKGKRNVPSNTARTDGGNDRAGGVIVSESPMYSRA